MTKPVETSAAEAAARVRAFADAWRARQVETGTRGGFLIATAIDPAAAVSLDETDLRALLDEREQQHGERTVAAQADRLTIEGLSALHERTATERDAAIARAEQAETDLGKARAGGSEREWGHGPEPDDVTAVDNWNDAHDCARAYDDRVYVRDVNYSEWRNAEPEDGHRG